MYIKMEKPSGLPTCGWLQCNSSSMVADGIWVKIKLKSQVKLIFPKDFSVILDNLGSSFISSVEKGAETWLGENTIPRLHPLITPSVDIVQSAILQHLHAILLPDSRHLLVMVTFISGKTWDSSSHLASVEWNAVATCPSGGRRFEGQFRGFSVTLTLKASFWSHEWLRSNPPSRDRASRVIIADQVRTGLCTTITFKISLLWGKRRLFYHSVCKSYWV